MANRFLAAMERSGDCSMARLKRLYRAASKRVHPDAAGPGSDSSAFLQIRRDYEAAASELRRREAAAVAEADALAADRPSPGPSEPPPLAAFRNASARFGAMAEAARCDEYGWAPPVAMAAAVVDSALALRSPASGAAELAAALAALRSERAAMLRYPGIMTRYGLLYRAFAAWSRYRASGSDVDAQTARTHLDSLEDPRATIVRSKAMAHVTEAFPPAATFLRGAWGLGDPRIISG